MASISICEIQSARFNLRRPLGSWAGRVRAHRHPSSVAIAAGRRTGSARRARSSGQRPTEPVARHPCWRRLLRVSRDCLFSSGLTKYVPQRRVKLKVLLIYLDAYARISVYSNGNARNRHRATYARLVTRSMQISMQIHGRRRRRALAPRLAALRGSVIRSSGVSRPYFFLGGGAASTGAVGCTSGLIMYSTSPSKTPRSPSVFTSASGVPNALV